MAEANRVKWLEVALYWERQRMTQLPAGTPGEMPDGLGGTTYADPETMRYILGEGELPS